MRSYMTMRSVLKLAAGARRELEFDDFAGIHPRDKLVEELKRLAEERLIESTVRFSETDAWEGGSVACLTPEGVAFYRLIENEDVWAIVLGVLKEADLDLSYPFLKEVCEEVVKRYVANFIPEIEDCK